MYGRPRVAAFLLQLLSRGVQERYLRAIGRFSVWCHSVSLDWNNADPEEQDWMLADYLLDVHDEDPASGLQVARDVVAAVQKLNPRRRYTVSWQVVSAWSRERPPAQAPPMPEHLAFALVT